MPAPSREKLIAAIASRSRNPQFNGILADAILQAHIPNIAEFLGQVFYESANLSDFTESLDYTVDALVNKFSRARISIEQAKLYGRYGKKPADQKMIANTIYGGNWGLKNLGNTQPNDGWHFKGVGPIQLTGRANITKFAKDIGDLDIIVNPHRIGSELETAAKSAVWYWTKFKNLDALGSNVREITRKVTGSASTAYNQRLDLTNHFRSLLK